MKDYKGSKEHITNAALASPIAFLMGGPAGVAATLGLGKLVDALEDRDYEKRREEWKTNNSQYIPITMDEIIEKTNEANEAINRIEDIDQLKNAKRIRGCANYKRGHENDTFIKIGGAAPLQYTKTGIGDGEVLFYYGSRNAFPNKRVKAKLFYYENDFLNSFMSDYKRNPNMEIYKIEAAMYKNGKWMYTTDNGNSFVVGL